MNNYGGLLYTLCDRHEMVYSDYLMYVQYNDYICAYARQYLRE
jgi:hypothetical protein